VSIDPQATVELINIMILAVTFDLARETVILSECTSIYLALLEKLVLQASRLFRISTYRTFNLLTDVWSEFWKLVEFLANLLNVVNFSIKS